MGRRRRRSSLSVTRGEIYTAAARGPYTGKPRPVVVVQDDRFDATGSVTICPFSTNPVDPPLIRLAIDPPHQNSPHQPARLTVAKPQPMPPPTPSTPRRTP